MKASGVSVVLLLGYDLLHNILHQTLKMHPLFASVLSTATQFDLFPTGPTLRILTQLCGPKLESTPTYLQFFSTRLKQHGRARNETELIVESRQTYSVKRSACQNKSIVFSFPCGKKQERSSMRMLFKNNKKYNQDGYFQ